MSGIAGYKLVRALRLGPCDSSWLAIGPGASEPGVVVETCEPVGECAVGVGVDGLGLFLDRRALQRRWADRIGDGPGGLGHGHVVAIRELGVSGDGGFAVRDVYDTSVGAMLRGKARLRGDVLLELISGVVAALRAIDTAAGRPHGDLDADAILVRDLRPGRMRVGLCAPACGLDADLDQVRRDELRRVGLLIYELVVQRPFRELGGYPVRAGSEWEAIGPDHGFWLGLVNDLLDAKSRTLTLDAVAARLDQVKFRKPGPGPVYFGGWAAAVLVVLAGVSALVLMPRASGPPVGEYKQPEFERWCRVTPGVLAFLERVEGLGDDAPGVLRDAGGLLTDGLDELAAYEGLTSLFDPNQTIHLTGYARLFDEGTEGLENRVREIAEFQVNLAAGEISDPAKRIASLDRVAGVYTMGLANLDGDESGDSPGFVANFGGENWPARLAVEARAEAWGAKPGWERAASLITEHLRTVDTSAGVIRDGVAFGGEMSEIDAGPVQAGSLEAVRSLVESVGQVEVLAETLSAIDARFEALGARAAELASRAVIEGLPEDVPGDHHRDPLLGSLPGLVGAIGVLGDAHDLDEIPARFDAIEAVFEDIHGVVVEGPWSNHGVDVSRMRRSLDLEVGHWSRPVEFSGDAAEVAERITVHIEVCRRWVIAAEASPSLEGNEHPSNGLSIGVGFDELGRKWAEAVAADAEESARIAAEELASRLPVDAGTTVEELLREGGGLVSFVEAGPHWESRLDVITPAVERANELGRVLDAVIGGVRAEVLEKPDEVYAAWRAGVTLDAAARDVLVRLGPLGDFREQSGEAMYARWRDWFDSLSPSMTIDEANREAESRAYRGEVKALEGVISRAAIGMAGIPDEYRVEAFEWGPIEVALLERIGEVVREVLSGVGDGWAEKDAGAPGGAIDQLVAEAIDAERGGLGELRDDLELLSVVREGLDRCELPGSVDTPDAAALTGLLGNLEGPRAGFVAAADDVQAVMGTTGRVLGLLSSGEFGTVLSRAVSPGAGPHPAERYAALLRAGELAEAGAVWPADVVGMRAGADRLGDGIAALRADLDSRPGAWAGVSERARGVVAGWWSRGFGVAGSEADLGVLVDEAPGWFDGLGDGWGGIADVGSLAGEALYDAEAYRIRKAVLEDARATMLRGENASDDELTRLDDGLKRRTSEALAGLRRLGRDRLDGDAGARVSGWIGVIEQEIAEAEAGRAGWDESDYGPVGAGLSGWRGELGEHPDETAFVTYTKDGVSITFHLLELVDGQKVFLAEDEFSVGLLSKIARALDVGEGSVISGWLEETTPDPRGGVSRPQGPLAQLQKWRRGKPLRVETSKFWLDDGNAQYGEVVPGEKYPAYPDSLGSGAGFMAISESQGRPSLDHPVNYVSYSAARAIAEAIGCRLPTVAEFERALAGQTAGPTSGVWNMRDSGTFPDQLRHYQSAGANRVTIHDPGADCYDQKVRRGDSADTWDYARTGGAESTLWFDKTGRGAGSGQGRFRHIIGNVAEYVETGGAKAAMGSSALSHPSVPPLQVVNGLRSTAGYADVGFRLAIDADDFGSLAKSIERLVSKSAREAFTFGGG